MVKHNDTDIHFVREIVSNGALILKHVSFANQLADLFTKEFGLDRFLN